MYASVSLGFVIFNIFKLLCCPDKNKQEREAAGSEKNRSSMNLCARFLLNLLELFLFVWLIIGSVWVLGKYGDWDDDGRPNCNGLPDDSDKCCHEGMFLFAFIFIIVAWSLIFLLICCGCTILIMVLMMLCSMQSQMKA